MTDLKQPMSDEAIASHASGSTGSHRGAPSRQALRSLMFDAAFARATQVDAKMSRAERRSAARAYVKNKYEEWKKETQ